MFRKSTGLALLRHVDTDIGCCTELRDQFRDDETAELREVRRELEATSKACRILQFKLRKAERRCEQLESERADYEEKVNCSLFPVAQIGLIGL